MAIGRASPSWHAKQLRCPVNGGQIPIVFVCLRPRAAPGAARQGLMVWRSALRADCARPRALQPARRNSLRICKQTLHSNRRRESDHDARCARDGCRARGHAAPQTRPRRAAPGAEAARCRATGGAPRWCRKPRAGLPPAAGRGRLVRATQPARGFAANGTSRGLDPRLRGDDGRLDPRLRGDDAPGRDGEAMQWRNDDQAPATRP